MNKKKCLNCLCMVDINAKVCPFCKTPFKEGRIQNAPRNKFFPPILGVTNKELENTNSIEIKKDIKENKIDIKNESKFKEIITFILNRRNQESPYLIPPFEIESLEIADIKDYEEENKKTFENPESISVDENYLQEINQLANLFVKEEEITVNENKEEEKKDLKNENKFISKDILRTEVKNIEDKKNQDEPVLNIKNLIMSLEEITKTENQNNFIDLKENIEIKKKIDDNKNLFDIKDLIIENSLIINKDTNKLKNQAKQENYNKHNTKDLIMENPSIINKENDKSINNKNEENNTKQLSDVKNSVTKKSLIINEENNKLKNEEKQENNIKKVSNEKDLLEKNKLESKAIQEIVYQPRSSENELALKHYNLARDLCVKKDYKKALIELEKSVNIDPKFEQAHILLSRTYIKLRKDGFIDVKE